MEAQAKALTDLTAAIFALKAKVNLMFSDILEPKQEWPSVDERSTRSKSRWATPVHPQQPPTTTTMTHTTRGGAPLRAR
jgi:hypothetical protein